MSCQIQSALTSSVLKEEEAGKCVFFCKTYVCVVFLGEAGARRVCPCEQLCGDEVPQLVMALHACVSSGCNAVRSCM
jgi:hypothetical protein